jgi:hypothetical protein
MEGGPERELGVYQDAGGIRQLRSGHEVGGPGIANIDMRLQIRSSESTKIPKGVKDISRS